MSGDVISIEGDDAVAGEPLLRPVMRAGRRIAASPSLAECRAAAARSLAQLPPTLRALEPATPYAVEVSPALAGLAAEVDSRLG
ncbi:MAG TPA: hypothetical protein VIY51_03400 [Xanthobacteraceae bacterium]